MFEEISFGERPNFGDTLLRAAKSCVQRKSVQMQKKHEATAFKQTVGCMQQLMKDV